MRALLMTLLMMAAPCFAAPKSFLIVVAGVGGEPEYSERFAAWTETMLEAAQSRMAIPRNRIVHLAEHYSVGIDGPSTKGELANAIETLASRAEQNDTIFLLLIGHGTAQYQYTTRGDHITLDVALQVKLAAGHCDIAIDGSQQFHLAAGQINVIINATVFDDPFTHILSKQ